ncbi:hypothetical protein BGX38DRAFT_1140902 [Terfezia claveryi]|nr:hypothetical protein BGX38DRAFT_1140902 [Terfezia claveryi]
MLNNNKQEGDLSLNEMKEEVYKEILRYLRIEGPPTEADSDFKELISITWFMLSWRDRRRRARVRREDFILILEAKRSSLGQAMKQCLIAMKDMHDYNGVGEIRWMSSDRQRWMDSHSIVVECIYLALSHGGMERKGVVVEG